MDEPSAWEYYSKYGPKRLQSQNGILIVCQPVIWVFPKIVVPPNHPFLIGFSTINHPFWDTPIFGNTHTLISISAAGQSYFLNVKTGAEKFPYDQP